MKKTYVICLEKSDMRFEHEETDPVAAVEFLERAREIFGTDLVTIAEKSEPAMLFLDPDWFIKTVKIRGQ